MTLALLSSIPAAAATRVISWPGNTPEWNSKLAVEEVRVGCSGTPGQCVGSLSRVAQEQKVDHVTLAIGADPETIAAYAREYSAISRKERRLRGIGVDDFVSALLRWKARFADGGAESARLLRTVIDNAKAENAGLEFGITVYEDQLSSSLLDSPVMPADVRARIDRVTLYVHFRENGIDYPRYVRRVRELFPKSAIVAGVYAYDRIDYLPCSQRSKRKCSERQERELFHETLVRQLSLLKSGDVSAIEFYPGDFGREEQWGGWLNPEACQPSRRQRCVDLTLELRKTALEMLQPSPVR